MGISYGFILVKLWILFVILKIHRKTFQNNDRISAHIRTAEDPTRPTQLSSITRTRFTWTNGKSFARNVIKSSNLSIISKSTTFAFTSGLKREMFHASYARGNSTITSTLVSTRNDRTEESAVMLFYHELVTQPKTILVIKIVLDFIFLYSLSFECKNSKTSSGWNANV